jgi:predicted nucleic acid-binding protein
VEHAFVDTTFLVARFNRKDRNRAAATEFLESQREPGATRLRLVMSDYVFDETVTTVLFRSGRHAVARAAGQALRDSKAIHMVHVDKGVFDAAWALFADRPDKRWSFTDCTSFVLMDRLDIRTALSFDRNFVEAGFATLP